MALDELDRDPLLVMQILQLRSYQRTFDACNNVREDGEAPRGKYAEWFYRFTQEVGEEILARRREALRQ